MERIIAEIEQVDFVAVILDETSDIVSKSQLSTMIHFVDEKCGVQGRFLGFTDVIALLQPYLNM